MSAGVLADLERVQEFVDFVIPDNTNGSRILREARATVKSLIKALGDTLSLIDYASSDGRCFTGDNADEWEKLEPSVRAVYSRATGDTK
jgi:hypothetical protein